MLPAKSGLERKYKMENFTINVHALFDDATLLMNHDGDETLHRSEVQLGLPGAMVFDADISRQNGHKISGWQGEVDLEFYGVPQFFLPFSTHTKVQRQGMVMQLLNLLKVSKKGIVVGLERDVEVTILLPCEARPTCIISFKRL